MGDVVGHGEIRKCMRARARTLNGDGGRDEGYSGMLLSKPKATADARMPTTTPSARGVEKEDDELPVEPRGDESTLKK